MVNDKIDIEEEIKRTRPDYVLYKPSSQDGFTHDTGNEEVHVFKCPDRSLMAVWTQSTFEGENDQRVVFSKSFDDGISWSSPEIIAGPEPGRPYMASWGFPLVSRTGRIYIIYSRSTGLVDTFRHTTGLLAGKYSEDAGKTWSEEKIIPVRRSIWDNPDKSVPPNIIVWQKPERLSDGKYFVGFTRWVSRSVRPPAPVKVWWAEASVVEFMRFENVDDNPEIEKIEISFFAQDKDALKVGLISYPDVPVAQEPSIVKLPDERLFCVMRTTTGSPYWSVSSDGGRTWTEPEPLRVSDNGPVMKHPCSPCPIYELGDGKYIFFFHNHDGHFGNFTPFDTLDHRRPIFFSVGEFKIGAVQPIWFSKPVFFMDNDGVRIGYQEGRADLSMYSSFIILGNRKILWYPDRKFFLLGKNISFEQHLKE
ncbi:MAG: glycoside hydrolase [Candidatus Omnitrophica bacterium]|nr:glycoside hydrolase [Candidatus Omnitrophota bacterium]